MIDRMLMAIVDGDNGMIIDGDNGMINVKRSKVAATITLFAKLTFIARAITQTMFSTHLKLLFLQRKS